MRCSRYVWLGVRITGALAVVAVMANCASTTVPQSAGPRDDLVGWYNILGRTTDKEPHLPSDTFIPVFKSAEDYYSVCNGWEVPLKVCPDGLEWALTPSSMVGTTIGFDKDSDTHYIVIKDNWRAAVDDHYIYGEKLPLKKIAKPWGLLDARTEAPKSNDDFCGWYHIVWMPGARFEIRKDASKYFISDQHLDEELLWKTHGEPRELTPIPGGLGFTEGRTGKVRLVYNEDLTRFEATKTRSAVIAMPLARVPAAASSKADKVPRLMRIGIPAWH